MGVIFTAICRIKVSFSMRFAFPSYFRRGGRDLKKMDPFLLGADGVVRNNCLTTPAALLMMLRDIFMIAQPPLLK